MSEVTFEAKSAFLKEIYNQGIHLYNGKNRANSSITPRLIISKEINEVPNSPSFDTELNILEGYHWIGKDYEVDSILLLANRPNSGNPDYQLTPELAEYPTILYWGNALRRVSKYISEYTDLYLNDGLRNRGYAGKLYLQPTLNRKYDYLSLDGSVDYVTQKLVQQSKSHLGMFTDQRVKEQILREIEESYKRVEIHSKFPEVSFFI